MLGCLATARVVNSSNLSKFMAAKLMLFVQLESWGQLYTSFSSSASPSTASWVKIKELCDFSIELHSIDHRDRHGNAVQRT